MKVEVIEKRANQVRALKCPVCNHEATIVIAEGKTEGSIHCWFCSSLLGWSIEDEVKEAVEREMVKPFPAEEKGKKGKKDVELEETE